MKNFLTGLVCALLIVQGCSPYSKGEKTTLYKGQAVMEEGVKNNNNLPSAKPMILSKEAQNALLPKTSVKISDPSQDLRFDVAVKNVPAQSFFQGLVAGTSYNMVVSPKVDGKISVTLKNVTIDQALAAVQEIYGYDYEKTSWGYKIYPPGLKTEIFSVNYLDVKRSGQSQMTINSGDAAAEGSSGGGSSGGTGGGGGGPSTTVNTTSSSAFWESLTHSLELIVGKENGHKVVVNSDAGLIIVTANRDELNQVRSYLDKMEATMVRQVLIEAKVLEVTLNDEFQSGIDWNLIKMGVRQDLGQGFGASNSIAALNNVFSISKASGSFSTVVNLLSTQGNVQVLSSPRIATLNNQKAVIKVGQDQYFITGVSNTTNGLGSTSQSTQQVQIAPFFSGIALGVTPQISKNNNVILHLHPIISTVTQQQISYVLGDTSTQQNLPSALTQVRESDSIVRAESGQVIVIGGLMQSTTQENISETPFLGEIPFVGAMFRSTKQISTKSELVILLKPIIIDNGVWNQEIQKSIEQYEDLDRSFHFGGKPETFGTEGERKFGIAADKK